MTIDLQKDGTGWAVVIDGTITDRCAKASEAHGLVRIYRVFPRYVAVALREAAAVR